MPQAFAYIGASLFMTQAAVTVGMFLMTYATVLGYATLLIGAMAYSNRQKKKAKQRYNDNQVDRLTTTPTTTGPRELVLGTVRKGGTLVFRQSTGTNKDRFVMVVALAGHQISGIQQVYFNDTLVTLDGSGNVLTAPYMQVGTASRAYHGNAVNPVDAPYLVPGSFTYREYAADDSGWRMDLSEYQIYTYSYYANVRFYLGTPDQTADARLMALFPGVWTAAHRGRGVAYMICEFVYNETAFPSSLPNVSVVMDGALCHDPRTSTTVFSNNPSVLTRHVVTHPYFGKRTSLTADEETRFIQAANQCDTSYTPTGGVADRIYRANTVFAYGTSAVDAIDDLMQAACGMWAYAGGEFYLKVGVYTSPVITFGPEHIVSKRRSLTGNEDSFPVGINPHRARADKLNVITPRIWDMHQQYKDVPLSPVKNSAAIAADGTELAQELYMPAVGRASQAMVVANFMLKDSRDPLTFTANFSMYAYPVEMFDTVALNLPRYGWTNKEFIVLARGITAEGSISMTLKETSAALYNPLIAPNSTGLAPDTNLIRPWDIQPPGTLTIESGTNHLVRQADGTVLTRVWVSWPAITDFRITQGGQIEVAWHTVAGSLNPVFHTVYADGADGGVYIIGPRDTSEIIVRARTTTSLARSPWGVQQSHIVVGKTAPPSNVTFGEVVFTHTQLYLRWNRVSDVDVAGYEVRSTNSGWGLNDDYQFKGDAAACPVTRSVLVWYIRAYDTTGNYSAASYVASVAFSPVSNVTGVEHVFTDTSLTAATVTLSWLPAVSQFPVVGYIVTDGVHQEQLDSTTITLPANWLGNRTFTIITIDQYGGMSAGVNYLITKLRPNSPSGLRAEVIDNNIQLYWTLPARTSLPISHSLIKSGLDWAGATVIGTKAGAFTALSELSAGEYTYWVAVVDTDGYESTPVSVTARVSQPPNFVFYDEFISTFTGTLNNAALESGGVLMPINLTETFQQHFVNNAWASPQAQVTAGFPIYIQPGTTTGYYQETFDLGNTLGSSSITVTLDRVLVSGTTTMVVDISTSLDNSTWTSFPGQANVFATNFRYVRVRVTATQVATGALVRLTQLTVTLDNRLKTDEGVTIANAGDPYGTILNFNSEFVDVMSILPAVQSVVPRSVTYDFLDAVLSGTYSVTSNVATINVTAHNLLVGQNVRLAPSSGTLPLGVYTVATVINANSYTVNITTPNTSGNLSTYNNSARLYVWDTDGVRQTNTVSWNIRGSS